MTTDLWLLRQWMRHPVDSWRWYRKAHSVPSPGDTVVDCRGRTLRVTAVDADDLTLEDGTRVSWMHCCDYPGEETT